VEFPDPKSGDALKITPVLLLILTPLGILVGAVLNALADDLPQRVRPRAPHCQVCNTPYRRWQWAALLALLTGHGRCARCGARILWRKPVVEIVSVILLVYVFQKFGLTPKSVLLSLLLECLLLITVTDLEHRLILHVTVIPSAVVAAAYGVFGTGFDLGVALSRTLIGGLVGYGFFYVIYLLGFVYSKWVAWRRGQPLEEEAFGGGDPNLGGVVGLAVGWPGIVLTLFYSVMAGGVVAVLYLAVVYLRRKQEAWFAPIPYGPCIVFGAVLLLLFAEELKRF